MPYGVDYGDTERRLAIAIAEAGGGSGGGTGGTVAVSNFPATQNVAGTVTIGNFPGTQPVSGTVSIGNFPATQTVSGSVSVSNFPASTTIAQPTAIANGLVNVANAGTRVQVSSSSVALVSGVNIKARPTNTGFIYVGNASVAAATGFILSARESVFIPVDNLNKVYIDASVNGEGVTYIGS